MVGIRVDLQIYTQMQAQKRRVSVKERVQHQSKNFSRWCPRVFFKKLILTSLNGRHVLEGGWFG